MHRSGASVTLATLALGALLAMADGAVAAPAPPDRDGDGRVNGRDACPSVAGTNPNGCPTGRWRLRNENTSGPADLEVVWGNLGADPIVGDWDDDGDDDLGTYDPRTGRFRLRDGDDGTVTAFLFAPRARGHGFAGDWDGDGTDTVGVYQPNAIGTGFYAQGRFRLTNDNAAGPPDITFTDPSPSNGYLWPYSGDWDGDGQDGTALVLVGSGIGRTDDGQEISLPGDARPVFGDWDGDDDDDLGWARLRAPLPWTLHDAIDVDPPWSTTFTFGTGNRPVAGDWDGDGIDTTGVFRR